MRRGRSRSRLDRFELGVLLVLLVLAVAPLTGLALRTLARGGVVTGGDGYLVADALQYLNWLRQAGRHVLIENLYDLQQGPRSFLHPGLLVSGGLHQLGLGVVLAYHVWKVPAVIALGAGAVAWTRRFHDRPGDRRLALVLAIFAVSPISALVGWTGWGGLEAKFHWDFVGGELWAGTYLWGYMFTAVAVGLLPLTLLAYERGRGGGAGSMLGWAAAAGALCAWLQPWQGATALLVVGGAEAVCVLRGHSWRRAARDLALPAGAIMLPLLYYYALSRLDPSWELAGEVNAFARWPWYVTLGGLAPLGVPALYAYRLPAPDFGGLALRAWPPAGLAVFYAPVGTFPFHAFQGLAIPLVVLSVLAVRHRLGDRGLPRAPVVAALAVLIVPGTAYRVDQLADAVSAGRQPFFLEPGERAAFRHLEQRPEAGGVLAPVYSGILVPAYAGRETWIGAGSWTPDFERRQNRTEDLFAGRMSRREAERYVVRTGARFLLSDCQGRADLEELLARVTEPPRRFGCAAVYRVRG